MKFIKNLIQITALLLLIPSISCFDDTDLIPEIVNYANIVVEAPGHTGSGYLDSQKAANGVRGGGLTSGGGDVFSLNYSSGNYIILRWENKIVLNGDGNDFSVFENPFNISGTNPLEIFMDLIIVSVSIDKTEWVDFPYDYSAGDESVYEPFIDKWIGFAGKNPVLYNEDTNKIDPFNQTDAGGDQFNLDDLPDTTAGIKIKNEGFRYIKLTTAPSLINLDTTENFVKDGICDGADIDGVYGRYFKDE